MVDNDYAYMILALTSAIWFPVTYYIGVHVVMFIINTAHMIVRLAIQVIRVSRQPVAGIPIVLEMSLKECGVPFTIVIQ